MLVRSLEMQCGARAARAAKREDFVNPASPVGLNLTGTTQLIRASLLNNLPRVLQLIQVGAPLDACCSSEATALFCASGRGHVHVAKALLDGKYEGRGAAINALTKSGWSPLAVAVQWPHGRLLLARGAIVDASALALTPVHNAAEIKALLEAHVARD
jgi:hypothetical protein